MKPIRLWMALDTNDAPKWGSSGYYLPLNKTAEDARSGWGCGFGKPKVIEVEVRPVARKKKRPKPYHSGGETNSG